MEDFRCTFCGRLRTEVERLVSGPRVFICNECIAGCKEVVGQPDAGRSLSYRPNASIPVDEIPAPGFPPSGGEVCNFCGREEEEAGRLIHGHKARLCPGCLDLCLDILRAG
jgi:ATP-dependent protease Clp ATPase subunit